MRKLAAVVLSLALVAAAAEPEGTPPPKGKVYALVAAMGDRFMATHEVVRTGSHLPPFRRNAINAPDNVAPCVFLKVWILDPQTLAVTDSQEVFEYQKMWDPKEVKDAPK